MLRGALVCRRDVRDAHSSADVLERGSELRLAAVLRGPRLRERNVSRCECVLDRGICVQRDAAVLLGLVPGGPVRGEHVRRLSRRFFDHRAAVLGLDRQPRRAVRDADEPS